MASATADALERANKAKNELREQKDEAEKSLRKWRSDAKEAAAELDKTGSKYKRLAEAVTDRESPERAVAVVLAAGAVSIGASAGFSYVTDKIGGAVPFVARNAEAIKGAVPTVLGLAGWVGELATRPRGPLTTGREIVSSTSAASLLLGVDRLGSLWYARYKANQRTLAAARSGT